MTVEEVPSSVNIKHLNRVLYGVGILSISFLSTVCDVFMGLILITQYYLLGYTSWAVMTFSCIFFPSVVLQILSIKLYVSNRDMLPIQWLFHSILLGIMYRYISAFKKCMRSYKSKSCMDSNSVKTDVIILKNLYLFKSFFECAPQLVLQLYIMPLAPFPLKLTGILASTSAFSIAWGLIIHTKFNKSTDCFGLVLLILWRVGMIMARISALVLCAYTCGPWMILFIGSHCLAMTLWITYQKTESDEKDKKRDFHSAFFGVIYCFCFFSIKTGQSRNKAMILNSFLLFQNLVFLTVFLVSFSAKLPRLAVISFITIIFGSLIGVTSFFIYNTFFHPRGPFKCVTTLKESTCCQTVKCSRGYNFPTLAKSRKKPDGTDCRPENEQLQYVQSPSDSIIIIEENATPNPKADEKMLQGSVEGIENVYDELKLAKPNEMKRETEEVKLTAALKRRAICSSVDLTRFLDEKSDDDALESSRNSKIVGAEETPSEISSTHDYENLCAVNIAREPWGIRSWRVYSDIETWRHDDSVFNERRMDNMTTSSEYSAKIEDKDSLNIAEDDLLNCEIDTNSDKGSVNYSVPPFPANMLHTIFEERESPTDLIHDLEKTKTKRNSESSLVATIDKICLYTPLRIRSGSIDYYVGAQEIRRGSGNESGDVKAVDESSVKMGLRVENKKDVLSPLKEKVRSVQKFNIFKERYETNRYQVCGKTVGSKPEGSGSGKRNETNEAIVSEESRKVEHNRTKKSFSFKDGSSFLVQMLTPTKLERRTFPISPPKR